MPKKIDKNECFTHFDFFVLMKIKCHCCSFDLEQMGLVNTFFTVHKKVKENCSSAHLKPSSIDQKVDIKIFYKCELKRHDLEKTLFFATDHYSF